jgi:hypothetical protein
MQQGKAANQRNNLVVKGSAIMKLLPGSVLSLAG